MKEQVKELERDAILILSSWWGLSPTPGQKEIIITKDLKVYSYISYHRLSKWMQDENIPAESLIGPVDLSNNIYDKLVDFIKNNIEGKEIENQIMKDAGYGVYININGFEARINNMDIYSELDKIIKELEFTTKR